MVRPLYVVVTSMLDNPSSLPIYSGQITLCCSDLNVRQPQSPPHMLWSDHFISGDIIDRMQKAGTWKLPAQKPCTLCRPVRVDHKYQHLQSMWHSCVWSVYIYGIRVGSLGCHILIEKAEDVAPLGQSADLMPQCQTRLPQTFTYVIGDRASFMSSRCCSCVQGCIVTLWCSAH